MSEGRGTLEFAVELMRRRSVTPNDAGCQALLAARLAAAGFTVTSLPFGDVTNLWAEHGASSPVLCFAGHTDVVPSGPREEWRTEPFDPTIRDGVLYGRGAADMKAGLAAMIDAACEYVQANPGHPGTLAFLITSDEEGKAEHGTRRVMEWLASRGTHIDWCIIGEPSCEQRLGDTVRIGRRGSLSGLLTVHGVAGHVAYPHLGRNPIRAFAPVLAEMHAQPLDAGNEFFPPSSLQVVRLESTGDAVNVTPGSLFTRFNIRYSTVWTHEQLKVHFQSLFDRHQLDYTLDWHLSGAPFLTPPGPLIDTIAAVVREQTGVTPALSTGGGTSDGRFIAPSGAQVVEFGALNGTIHKPNEALPVADLEVIRRVYGAAIPRLLG
jgi:succinyl-diaminopimelate desuccinylase